MTAAAIAAALYGAFGLEPPAAPPAPVPASRFLTLTAGPPGPACPLRADRLVIGGAVTLTTPTRRIHR